MKKRFHNKLGEEYGLFSLACPHFLQLESLVGETISSYFAKNNGEISVLEIGCGDGFTSSIILESNQKVHLTSIDNEEIMIKKTSQKLVSQRFLERTTLIQEDALTFLKSQKNESFDVFASAFTLHNFDQEYRRECLKEIFRILKKGALFVNSDKYALDCNESHEISLSNQLNEFKRVFSRFDKEYLAKGWIEHYLEDNKEDKIMIEGESKLHMKKIGFKEISTIFRKGMEATITAVKN